MGVVSSRLALAFSQAETLNAEETMRLSKFTMFAGVCMAVVAATCCVATRSALAQAPVVNAPATVSAFENSLLTFVVSASGAGISSFGADLSAFPPGPTFTSGPLNTMGTFSWTPRICQDAGVYQIVFTATNVGGSGSAATTLTVRPVRTTPSCGAGGPYQATLASPICFSAASATGACGASVSYSWDFGDGTTGAGQQACHTYGACGRYDVALTVTDAVNPALSSRCTTTADVTFFCQATVVRCPSDSNPVNLNSSPDLCVTIQSVGTCFLPGALGAATMTYGGKMISSSASASPPNSCSSGTLCFSKTDLGTLFASLPNGKTPVNVPLSGKLSSGCSFQATLAVEVQK